MTDSLISFHVHEDAWWYEHKDLHFHLQIPYLNTKTAIDNDPAPMCVEINWSDARKLERRGTHKVIGSGIDRVVVPVVIAQRDIVFQIGERAL